MIRNIIPWRIKKLLKEKRIIFPFSSVVIEVSSMCNIRCVWCWMYNSKKKDFGMMELKNFKKFIDDNQSFFKRRKLKLIPFFRGESLIHPDFFEMANYANKKGYKFGKLDTNLSIDIDIEKLMSSPLK